MNVKRTVGPLLSRNNALSRENGLARDVWTVAQNKQLGSGSSSASSPTLGDADGKELGRHSVGARSAVAAVAPAQIAAVMRSATLSAAEKQQCTQKLRASSTPASATGGSSVKIDAFVHPELAALEVAHAAWLRGQPPLPLDTCGLTVWPRSNTPSNITSTKTRQQPGYCAGRLERAQSPSTSTNSEDSAEEDCEWWAGSASTKNATCFLLHGRPSTTTTDQRKVSDAQRELSFSSLARDCDTDDENLDQMDGNTPPHTRRIQRHRRARVGKARQHTLQTTAANTQSRSQLQFASPSPRLSRGPPQ